jgi:hypothetical protein
MKHLKKHITKKRKITKKRRLNHHRTVKKYDGGIGTKAVSSAVILSLLGSASAFTGSNPLRHASNIKSNRPSIEPSKDLPKERFISAQSRSQSHLRPKSQQIISSNTGNILKPPPPPPRLPLDPIEEHQPESPKKNAFSDEFMTSLKKLALEKIKEKVKEKIQDMLHENLREVVEKKFESALVKIINTMSPKTKKHLKITIKDNIYLINNIPISIVLTKLINFFDSEMSQSTLEIKLLLQTMNIGKK